MSPICFRRACFKSCEMGFQGAGTRIFRLKCTWSPNPWSWLLMGLSEINYNHIFGCLNRGCCFYTVTQSASLKVMSDVRACFTCRETMFIIAINLYGNCLWSSLFQLTWQQRLRRLPLQKKDAVKLINIQSVFTVTNSTQYQIKDYKKVSLEMSSTDDLVQDI